MLVIGILRVTEFHIQVITYMTLLNSTWVSDVNYTTNFNDSSGSVGLEI